jgi:hypothetical protein
MRYLMLIYSQNPPDPSARNYAAHRALIDEASRAGVFVAAEPLAPASTATTVRVENGKPLLTDGPFVETKEQLAGYYIFDCRNLDEAIEWAAKLPGACTSSPAVEIRPMPGMP